MKDLRREKRVVNAAETLQLICTYPNIAYRRELCYCIKFIEDVDRTRLINVYESELHLFYGRHRLRQACISI